MNGSDFERNVISIARVLWPLDPSSGPEFIDGKERDGIFYAEDVIHLIEATIEKSEDKAKQDCKKLAKLAGEIRKKHEDKVVKCWFITKNEPTDRQRTVAKSQSYPVMAVSFNQFQSKLVNATDYIQCRKKHIFGSIQKPTNTENEIKFVEVEVKERSSEKIWRIGEICKKLAEGEKISLTADYGAGKSMILREVFFKLSEKYLSGKTEKFPVHINLREHSGAQYPDEVLERHARIIGFNSTAHLVRAWRAGYIILILDGFDEITSLGFQGRWSKLNELRFKGLKAIREMISQQPSGSGIILAGREYYFDSHSELQKCLGISDSLDITLNDFTQEQVDTLLTNCGIPTAITPAWLPKRPLFVATLALRGHLAGISKLDSSVGKGWNELIESICERESGISGSLEASSIRRVLENVATTSRCMDGEISLSRKQLTDAFIQVCGYEPDEQGVLLLERLPGLGVPNSGSESRVFVDQDFEFALAAADVARFFVEPWMASGNVEKTCRPLSSIGIAVAKSILENDKRKSNPQAAIDRSPPTSALRADLINLGISLRSQFTSNVSVNDIHIPEMDISGEINIDGLIYFNECIFDNLYIDPSSEAFKKIKLQGCLIRSLSGVHSSGDIKSCTNEACMIEDFTENVKTNADILEASFALPVRVLLVTLRKLFLQSGRGRRENAFYRGLDGNAQRYVSDILEIIISEGIASKDNNGGEPIYIKNRHELSRITSILSAPETSNDPLIIRVRSLA